MRRIILLLGISVLFSTIFQNCESSSDEIKINVPTACDYVDATEVICDEVIKESFRLIEKVEKIDAIAEQFLTHSKNNSEFESEVNLLEINEKELMTFIRNEISTDKLFSLLEKLEEVQDSGDDSKNRKCSNWDAVKEKLEYVSFLMSERPMQNLIKLRYERM